ncbi:hypothetical protein GIB67_007474 [Kingdonia uniflora]|uniref:DUF4283 domain-containing protein n=1 Tax=Kingdonia uniflora TaxID=39325 RepID=A0A7J7MME0_9MAGN|nr:hypothetical protein GIB67_007474 [Kingdonia uniflora]
MNRNIPNVNFRLVRISYLNESLDRNSEMLGYQQLVSEVGSYLRDPSRADNMLGLFPNESQYSDAIDHNSDKLDYRQLVCLVRSFLRVSFRPKICLDCFQMNLYTPCVNFQPVNGSLISTLPLGRAVSELPMMIYSPTSTPSICASDLDRVPEPKSLIEWSKLAQGSFPSGKREVSEDERNQQEAVSASNGVARLGQAVSAARKLGSPANRQSTIPEAQKTDVMGLLSGEMQVNTIDLQKIANGHTLKKNDEVMSAAERDRATIFLEERKRKAQEGLPNSNTQPLNDTIEAFQKRYTQALAANAITATNMDTEITVSSLRSDKGNQGIEVNFSRGEPISCQKGSAEECACERCIGSQLDQLQALSKDGAPGQTGKPTDKEGAPPTATKSWASLLSVPSKVRGKIPLVYTSVVGDEFNPVIDISENEFGEEKKKYEDYLVGSFIGKKLAYQFVKDTLSKLWALKGDFEMSTKGFNMYFKFSNPEDREKALEAGSQHIASRLFILRPWRPFIEVESLDLTTIPIWVVLKNVPVNMRNHEGLGRIASSIGIPLYLDRATEEGGRNSFSRVCVEVTTKCKFPGVITLKCANGNMPLVYAEYAWFPIKCSHCGVFGHTDYSCEHSPKPLVSSKQTMAPKLHVPEAPRNLPKQQKDAHQKQSTNNSIVRQKLQANGKQKQQQQRIANTNKESIYTSNKFQALNQEAERLEAQDTSAEEGQDGSMAVYKEVAATENIQEEVSDV